MHINIDALRFDERGLIPTVVQEHATGEVLMVAFMNRESIEKTLSTGYTWFYSRSRQRLWKKGEQSGHVQKVHRILADCDGDTLLIHVTQHGPGACHTGHRTCFYQHLSGGAEETERPGETEMAGKGFDPETVYGKGRAADILEELYEVIAERKQNPKEGSYTTYLFTEGINKILKKVGEESAEVIIAAKDPDDEPLIYEAADLLYHLLVLLAERNIRPEAVLEELSDRRGGGQSQSGS